MKVRGALEEGRWGETRWGYKGRRREAKQWQTRKRKSMLSLINSNSPHLHGGLSLQSFFFSTPIFPTHLPLSVLISLCSTPPISYLSCLFHSFSLLSFFLCNSMLSALSSELSHFLPFQPFWFLSSKYSISHPYCEFSLCASNLSSKYCAIKWFENSLTLYYTIHYTVTIDQYLTSSTKVWLFRHCLIGICMT